MITSPSVPLPAALPAFIYILAPSLLPADELLPSIFKWFDAELSAPTTWIVAPVVPQVGCKSISPIWILLVLFEESTSNTLDDINK